MQVTVVKTSKVFEWHLQLVVNFISMVSAVNRDAKKHVFFQTMFFMRKRKVFFFIKNSFLLFFLFFFFQLQEDF